MSKKAKVLILHHVSDQGGGTKSLIDIAVMLANNFDVTICLPMASKETGRFADEYGIRNYEVKTPIPTLNIFSGGPQILSTNFLRGIINWRYIDELANELLQLNPDVIIFNSIVTAIIARKIPKRVKTICFIRETLVGSLFYGFIKSTFEKYIDGVAYIAEHEKRTFNLQNPVQIVIPDTLEPSTIKNCSSEIARQQYNIGKDIFVALYMGGSARLKGFDVALKAASCLDKHSCILVVGTIRTNDYSMKNCLKHLYNIGHVRYQIRVKRLLDKLREDPRMKLLGYQKNISELMCACDVVIFPSTEPHQPRPCIEAGMYKKAVILSDYEATKEYFIDGFNALTFKPKDGKDLAKRIERLRNDKELRAYLEENNYVMSVENHNFKQAREKTIKFVQKISELQK